MSEQYKLIHPIKNLRDFLDSKIRLDGRSFNKCRPIGMNTESFTHSMGSSAIKIGNSNVICGIRAELTKPRVNTPSKGYIVPNIDVSFSSQTYLNSAQEFPELLSCLIHNVLLDFECIKLEDLCIHSKKLVWCLYIDIICLEIDGAIFDASILACIAALSNLEIPQIIYEDKTSKVEISDEMKRFHINATPIICTYGIFDRVLLADPTYDEESISNALIYIGVSENDIGVFHKRGGVPIEKQQLDSLLNDTISRRKEITLLLDRFKK